MKQHFISCYIINRIDQIDSSNWTWKSFFKGLIKWKKNFLIHILKWMTFTRELSLEKCVWGDERVGGGLTDWISIDWRKLCVPLAFSRQESAILVYETSRRGTGRSLRDSGWKSAMDVRDIMVERNCACLMFSLDEKARSMYETSWWKEIAHFLCFL